MTHMSALVFRPRQIASTSSMARRPVSSSSPSASFAAMIAPTELPTRIDGRSPTSSYRNRRTPASKLPCEPPPLITNATGRRAMRRRRLMRVVRTSRCRSSSATLIAPFAHAATRNRWSRRSGPLTPAEAASAGSDDLLAVAEDGDGLRRAALAGEHDLVLGLALGVRHDRDAVVV